MKRLSSFLSSLMMVALILSPFQGTLAPAQAVTDVEAMVSQLRVDLSRLRNTCPVKRMKLIERLERRLKRAERRVASKGAERIVKRVLRQAKRLNRSCSRFSQQRSEAAAEEIKKIEQEQLKCPEILTTLEAIEGRFNEKISKSKSAVVSRLLDDLKEVQSVGCDCLRLDERESNRVKVLLNEINNATEVLDALDAKRKETGRLGTFDNNERIEKSSIQESSQSHLITLLFEHTLGKNCPKIEQVTTSEETGQVVRVFEKPLCEVRVENLKELEQEGTLGLESSFVVRRDEQNTRVAQILQNSCSCSDLSQSDDRRIRILLEDYETKRRQVAGLPPSDVSFRSSLATQMFELREQVVDFAFQNMIQSCTE